MASRRMFSREILFSDDFLDLPQSAQNLYFFVCLDADDEGFCGSTRRIIRMVGCSEADLQALTDSGFVIHFEDSTVVVVTDWKRHNYIRGDRLAQTQYKKEKALVAVDKSLKYYLVSHSADKCQSNDREMAEQEGREYREGRLEENRKEERVPPAADSFEKNQTEKYVPLYWELTIPEEYWGRFKTEDDYWDYRAKEG